MKYLVVLCDGMSDEPIEALGGQTPMEAAKKPVMDSLVKSALVGTVLNVPASMKPESDTANLAVLSYDPLIYSKGRSSLEALSMGLDMSETQTAIRCNVVTLSEEEENYEEGFDFGDEDTTIYEVKCICGNVIAFDEETLEAGSIVCDECGETLEFSFEDEDEDEE